MKNFAYIFDMSCKIIKRENNSYLTTSARDAMSLLVAFSAATTLRRSCGDRVCVSDARLSISTLHEMHLSIFGDPDR